MADIGVLPRDEKIKAHLRHPSGRRFENYPQPTPWPNDQFTSRRIIEGAVLTEVPKVEESEAPRKPQPRITAAKPKT